MVQEAEANRSTDQQLRQEVDARNELDTVAYQVQRRLDERGDAVPEHERARAEMLVAEARQAVADQAPLERARELTGELQQVLASLSVGASAGAGAGADPYPTEARTGVDDVIDAEFDRG
jgi:molecular chaperone DnaK